MAIISKQILEGEVWTPIYKSVYSSEPIKKLHISNDGTTSQRISIVVSKTQPNPGSVATFKKHGLLICAKTLGQVGNDIAFYSVKGKAGDPIQVYAENQNEVEVRCAIDENSNIISTVSEVCEAINNDPNASQIVKAFVYDETKANEPMIEINTTNLTGGTDPNTSLNYLLGYKIESGGALDLVRPFTLKEDEYIYIKSEIPTISIVIETD